MSTRENSKISMNAYDCIPDKKIASLIGKSFRLLILKTINKLI